MSCSPFSGQLRTPALLSYFQLRTTPEIRALMGAIQCGVCAARRSDNSNGQLFQRSKPDAKKKIPAISTTLRRRMVLVSEADVQSGDHDSACFQS
jgi:hypothetical protein